jgi:hypothetical protein
MPKHKQSGCTGNEKREVTLTAYGKRRQDAYDNLWDQIALLANPDTCTGDECGSENFECLPHAYLDPTKIECIPYRTRKGKVRWSATFDGLVTYKCKCAPAE